MTWDNMIEQEIINLTGVTAMEAMTMKHIPARVLYMESINRLKKRCFEVNDMSETKKKTSVQS